MEMEIKTTRVYHLTSVRMIITKRLKMTIVGEDVRYVEPSYTGGM